MYKKWINECDIGQGVFFLLSNSGVLRFVINVMFMVLTPIKTHTLCKYKAAIKLSRTLLCLAVFMYSQYYICTCL